MPGFIILALSLVAVLLICLSKVSLVIRIEAGTDQQKDVGIVACATARVSFLWLSWRYRAQLERTPTLCLRYGFPGSNNVLRGQEPSSSIERSKRRESMKGLERTKKAVNISFKKYTKTIKALIENLIIQKLSLKCRIGLGEAAWTAMAVGAARAFCAAFITANAYIRERGGGSFDITPDFRQSVFEITGECILSVRFGKVICIAAAGAYETFKGR